MARVGFTGAVGDWLIVCLPDYIGVRLKYEAGHLYRLVFCHVKAFKLVGALLLCRPEVNANNSPDAVSAFWCGVVMPESDHVPDCEKLEKTWVGVSGLLTHVS